MKKEIKKFEKIINYEKVDLMKVLQKGDSISITEKLDGANASFIKDDFEELGISCFSRNQKLHSSNTLQGFYNYVEKNIVPIENKLNPNYRYIGEWLVKHKILYKEDKYKDFYLFAIYDEETEKYLSDDIVISEAKRLGLNTVEFFYKGNFIDIEHIKNFIGKSNLTYEKDNGEGIVLKALNKETQVFLKLVSDKFKECKIPKKEKTELFNWEQKKIINELCSKNRVEKNIFKLVDEGMLDKECLVISNMKNIIKPIIEINIKDIFEEDKDIINILNIEENQLKKSISKIIPSRIREILEK